MTSSYISKYIWLCAVAIPGFQSPWESLQKPGKGQFQNPKATETLRPRRKHVLGLPRQQDRGKAHDLQSKYTAGGKCTQGLRYFHLTFVRVIRPSNCGDQRSVCGESLTHAQTHSHAPKPCIHDCGLDGLFVMAGNKPFNKWNVTGKSKAYWFWWPSETGSKCKIPVTKLPWWVSGKQSFSIDRMDSESSTCRCGLTGGHIGNLWNFCM